MNGSYPQEVVTKNFTSPGVTVVGQSASGVTIADLEAWGSWTTYDNLTINQGLVHNCTCSPGNPTNVTLNNVNFRAVNLGGNPYSTVWIQSGTNISWNNSDFGPAPIGQGQGEPIEVWATQGNGTAKNVVINGLNFHDVYRTPSCDAVSCHTEVIRVDEGVDGFTVENSTFQDMGSQGPNSSYILLGNNGTSENPATDMLFENNFFGNDGANGVDINGGQCPQLGTIKVSYNTARNSLLWASGSSGIQSCPAGFTAVGNLNWQGSCYGTHDHNIWFASTGTCGSDQKLPQPPYGFVPDGWHLAPGSPAIHAGSPTYCPPKDHDLRPRPEPPGTTCDAGANEAPDPICDASQLKARILRSAKSGASNRILTVALNNIRAACQMEGYAGLRLQIGKRPVPTRVRHGISSHEQRPSTVGLSPGARATFLIVYSTIAARGRDQCTRATRLGVRPPGQGRWLEIHVSLTVCDRGTLLESPVIAGVRPRP
jgi:hypothetical protein